MPKAKATGHPSPDSKPDLGPVRIVVVDRGYVYVGRVVQDGDFFVVTNASNVRRWGTTQGLGELALNGPTTNTKLDPVGTVRVPSRALISLIDTEDRLWKGF